MVVNDTSVPGLGGDLIGPLRTALTHVIRSHILADFFSGLRCSLGCVTAPSSHRVFHLGRHIVLEMYASARKQLLSL